MLFDEKKMDIVSIEELVQCPVSSVEPYALMLAPIYVLMKRNGKLVSVKAPLDFFTPEELESLKVYERFFIPQFIKSVVRFQTAAKIVRSLLKPVEADLAPAPFEISNEMMNVLGSLWGKDCRVESFFATVLADELCGPLDPEALVRAREMAVIRHDLGLLLSGTLIFILLQLGWFDFNLISEIRNQTYVRTSEGENWENPVNAWESINHDLIRMVDGKIPLDRPSLELLQSEWAKKILGRMKRLEGVPSMKKHDSLTIYGPEGFAA